MVKHVIIKLKLKDLSASLKSIKGELKRNKEIKLKKNFLQDRSTCPKRMQPKRPTRIATRRETSLLLWRQLNSNILLFYNQVSLFWTFFLWSISRGPSLDLPAWFFWAIYINPGCHFIIISSSSSFASSTLPYPMAILLAIYNSDSLFSIYAPRK